MTTIDLRQLTPKRLLITRDDARHLGRQMLAISGGSPSVITLNLASIEGLTPSFVDELLEVLLASQRARGIDFVNMPTHLSTKFQAIGRARGLGVDEVEPGRWVIRRLVST